MRIAASVLAAIAGLLVAARAIFGPFPGMHSPLNAESIFALAVLILLALSPNSPVLPVASPGSTREQALHLLSLALIVAAVFSFSAHGYFLSDDFVLLRHAQEPVSIQGLFATAGSDGFFRPLFYGSMRVTFSWAGADPFRWHLVSLVIHTLNAMLVLLMARALQLPPFAAWFAGALFAIHGSCPEAVVWIAARSDLLATFFVLLALLLFLRDYRWLALVAMVAALLCKESAYACPLLLLLLAPRRWRALIPFFLAAAVLFAYRFWLFGGIGGYKTANGEPQALDVGIVSIAKALVLRIWAALFFPINWSIPPGWLIGVAIAVYVGALLWFCKDRLPVRAALPMAFVIISALPPLQQLLIGADLQKARYLYLPSVGLCLLFAGMVQQRRSLAAAILAFNLLALIHNLTAWHDAATQVKATCAAAARGENVDVSQLPNSIHGVYFLQNGFPECVQMAVR